MSEVFLKLTLSGPTLSLTLTLTQHHKVAKMKAQNALLIKQVAELKASHDCLESKLANTTPVMKPSGVTESSLTGTSLSSSEYESDVDLCSRSPSIPAVVVQLNLPPVEDVDTLYLKIRKALSSLKEGDVYNALMDREDCTINRDSFFENINGVCKEHVELSNSQKDVVWRHLDTLECLRNRTMNLSRMKKAFFEGELNAA